MTLNEVILTATVVDTPFRAVTNSNTPVCNIRAVIRDRYTDATGQQRQSEVYVTVVAWKNLVGVAESLQQGDTFLVKGKLVANKYTRQDGTETYELRVSAFALIPVDQAESAPQPSHQVTAPPPPPPPPPAAKPARRRKAEPVAAGVNGHADDDIPI